MNNEVMIYFCEELLHLQKPQFVKHLSNLATNYLLECAERDPYQFFKTLQWDLPFDQALKNLNQLLNQFHQINEAKTLKKDENKFFFEFDGKKEHYKLVDIASNIHSLIKRTLRSCDALKRDQNSTGIQVASLFEMVVSIFTKIYVKIVDTQDPNKVTVRAITSFSNYRDETFSDAQILI